MFRGVCLDPLCILTDYCPEGSLHQLLSDKSQDVPMSLKIKFIQDIVKGMVHLHFGMKQEIIHRDLAARNIFIKNGCALIGDLGMARLKNANLESNNTVNFVGPLKWMAPEAFLHCEYSRKSDVFSFGVVVWEIVTRLLPWSEFTPVQASHAVAKGQRLAIPEDCPSILKDIMLLCWREDARRRPEATDIMEILKGSELYANKKKMAPVPPPRERGNSQTSEYAKMPDNVPTQYQDEESQYEDEEYEDEEEEEARTEYTDSAVYDESKYEEEESQYEDEGKSQFASQTQTLAAYTSPAYSRRTEDDRSSQYFSDEYEDEDEDEEEYEQK